MSQSSRSDVTDLYLIRHGESVPNVRPIVGGMRGDSGLSDRGRQQARALEERLRREPLPLDLLIVSTLPRALETAQYVSRALGLPIQTSDEVQELRPGEADGLSHNEWMAKYSPMTHHNGEAVEPFAGRLPDYDPFRPFAPGGESWASFLYRAGKALNDIVRQHAGQAVGVVCHGGVIEVSFYLAFGLGPTGTKVTFAPRNTGITHWRFGPDPQTGQDTWRLMAFNDARHLDEAGIGDLDRVAVPTEELHG